MRFLFDQDAYSELEIEARNFMGIEPGDHSACKPLVARYVAQNIARDFSGKVSGLWTKYDEAELVSCALDYLELSADEGYDKEGLIVRYAAKFMVNKYQHLGWEKVLELGERIAGVGL